MTQVSSVNYFLFALVNSLGGGIGSWKRITLQIVVKLHGRRLLIMFANF